MNRLFVDHLTVLDFSYLHPVRGMVGESWILSIELCGRLNEQGMLFDFGEVKNTLRNVAEQFMDHKLVVPDDLPDLAVELSENRVFISYQFKTGQKIELATPLDAIAFVPLQSVSREAMEALLCEQLQTVVPDNVVAVSVSLEEEQIRGAYYHYTHGLKKHAGNCQRIAHGHRSKLEIYTDGQRSQLTEYQWAKKWKDIYIGSKEDVKTSEHHNGMEHTRFHYLAAQGEFELLLPSSSVYLIETDTTVEWIAEHIATTLKNQRPQNKFKVRCYEGIKKGAIAEL
jgi:6-pyruvoyl-tetrahydropterin synthase